MVEFAQLPDDIIFLIYDQLEVLSIKKLQYFPELAQGIRHYLYGHSRYLICLDEDPKVLTEHNQNQQSQFRHSEIEDTPFDMAGYKLSKLIHNESMRNHISHFKYYQIEILISQFDSTLALLELYKPVIHELFYREEEEGTKNIRLHIRLHYTMNTFYDMKNCLVNVDKISHFFNNNNKNSVQIDLELNRR
ncbi:uncharacterized protein SPAPADRAFT_63657 [Spathaspora passalidarum NRRL Y-27907]|uniref:F-box domain-containing protein n=1 Tax=Spathaspora passalidarum (strain NRRL Y-27907 / 11-Y1) TaxID=619300 RepID=G3AUV2_SPAPN|nr:uncharacterized protein SPAPADRAFT_63657 [Spathaspora passalidarum NRRL Y-27907]EGW30043.1 hypothetical protein SPAPADRAFT_63657 [Spathaspora passalidarum NRRL Y-27907]